MCSFHVPDIILLGQTKESSDLGGAFGTEALRVDNVGETRDVAIALFDNGQSQNRQILSDDAATDRLALAFTGSARSIAGVAFRQEESDTGRKHLEQNKSQQNFLGEFLLALSARGECRYSTYNALLHGKALLVIAAGDAEDL